MNIKFNSDGVLAANIVLAKARQEILEVINGIEGVKNHLDNQILYRRNIYAQINSIISNLNNCQTKLNKTKDIGLYAADQYCSLEKKLVEEANKITFKQVNKEDGYSHDEKIINVMETPSWVSLPPIVGAGAQTRTGAGVQTGVGAGAQTRAGTGAQTGVGKQLNENVDKMNQNLERMLENKISEVVKQNDIIDFFSTNNDEGISKADIFVDKMIDEGLISAYTSKVLISIINTYVPNASVDEEGYYNPEDLYNAIERYQNDTEFSTNKQYIDEIFVMDRQNLITSNKKNIYVEFLVEGYTRGSDDFHKAIFKEIVMDYMDNGYGILNDVNYCTFIANKYGLEDLTLVEAIIDNEVILAVNKSIEPNVFLPTIPIKTDALSGFLDVLQTGLDIIGMIPLVGEPFDLINSGISFERGDVLGGLLSAASVIPLAGWGSTIGKHIGKYVDDVTLTAASAMFKNVDEIPIKVIKNLDEFTMPIAIQSKNVANDATKVVGNINDLTKYSDEVVDSLKVVENTGDGLSDITVEVFKGGKTSINGNSAFANTMDDILKKQGLTVEEFNSLRLRDVSTLSDAEKASLKAIRESIPMPDTDTSMQKVIPSSDLAKYMDGTFTQVGGYVTKAEDVSQLSTYDELYDSLRLDYPNSAYQSVTDDSLGVIRYNTSEVSKIEIPYGTEMGGKVTEAAPFTGNGFTKATNGQIIPEYKCDGYLEVEDGAQLIEISKDGTETLKAVYSEIKGKFIPVK
jgi:hypothetical protein